MSRVRHEYYLSIYGALMIETSLVIELLDLANAYCESNLKKHCIRMIKQGITVSNVAYLYSIAIEYNAEVTLLLLTLVFH